MIQKIFIRASIILALSFAFYACNSRETKDEKKQSDQVKADSTAKDSKKLTATYQCPMKCEGDKTYAEAGTCPECKMDLVKVE